MHNITFVIFTYNEEKRIERVIKNFKDYGKILLADNKSTDKTREIALSYGCEILTREKHYVFVENQEMANLIYDKITTNWIYWGFADEMLEKKTLTKILSVIEADKHDIINIDRKNYFYGDFCYNLYHARTNKIFKKNAIDFTNNAIHGMGTATVPADKIYQLPDAYFVHHFISNTATSYLSVINNYTEAELTNEHKSHISIWYLFKICIKGIIINYLSGRGYKAKFSGVALTELSMFYEIIKNMKHYEKQRQLSNIEIEKKNNYYRDNILYDQYLHKT